jgi:hypothetical protein
MRQATKRGFANTHACLAALHNVVEANDWTDDELDRLSDLLGDTWTELFAAPAPDFSAVRAKLLELCRYDVAGSDERARVGFIIADIERLAGLAPGTEGGR